MTPPMIVAAILAMAVLISELRLGLWRRGALRDGGAPRWRILVLAAAQPVCACLVFLCLFPPSQPVARGTMVVATGGAPRVVASPAGTYLVVLPEGPAVAGAERAPDLGTALRRHPDVANLRVLGNGLLPRDVGAVQAGAVQGWAISFDPPADRRGLVALSSRIRVAPGGGFSLGGEVAGLARARVELIDPAGRVTDRQGLDDDGRFVLSGTARAAGAAIFVVRVKDGAGRVVEQANVPVRIDDEAAPRLLILAGAPGPEVKYLRRWATDAGFVVNTQMSTGGGLALGDPPIALDAASLSQFDVAIVDDRSWSGRQAALMQAVRGGLGLVLRASGPLDGATRSDWRRLGFSMSGTDALTPIALPAPGDADIARTRRGIGSSDAPDQELLEGEVLPEVSRLALTPGSSEAVPILSDAAGATLAAWRAMGTGRVAVFTGIDSYGLTLTGRRALFNDWWSAILSATARAARAAPGDLRATGDLGVVGGGAAVGGFAWVGERVIVCGVGAGAGVRGPDGAATLLQSETNGCAGFWPTQSGWHQVLGLDGAAGTGAFYVWPTDQLAGIRAARDRDATLMLTGRHVFTGKPGDSPAGSATSAPPRRPGPSWPWFLGWLVASGGLWAFERSRIGRPAGVT